MKRIATLLAFLAFAVPGSGSSESVKTGPVAEAIRILLAELENGAISDEELARLLLANAMATLLRPESSNLPMSTSELTSPQLTLLQAHELEEASAIATGNAILIDDVPVVTISSPHVIPAAAFSSDGTLPDSVFFDAEGGFFQGNAQEYGCLVAPVFLPEGVTVTDLDISFYDNDTVHEIQTELRRVSNFSGAVTPMGTARSQGSAPFVRTASAPTITAGAILYPDYSYYLTTCLQSSDTRLYSVQIDLEP
jgi:hypothetical protein